jgi:hypothetical protein
VREENDGSERWRQFFAKAGEKLKSLDDWSSVGFKA